jgi:hypothetical protein
MEIVDWLSGREGIFAIQTMHLFRSEIIFDE